MTTEHPDADLPDPPHQPDDVVSPSSSPSATQAVPAEPVVAPPTVVAHPAREKAPTLLRVLSVVVMVSGLIMLAAGVATWFVVRDQLSQEHITVSDDAEHFAGEAVDSPWTAYAQAQVIHEHEMEIGGGKTYAELPKDDPARDTVMNASFLRASLFTSVVSFGVAAFAAGVGVLMLIVGYVMLRLVRLFDSAAAPAVATTT